MAGASAYSPPQFLPPNPALYQPDAIQAALAPLLTDPNRAGFAAAQMFGADASADKRRNEYNSILTNANERQAQMSHEYHLGLDAQNNRDNLASIVGKLPNGVMLQALRRAGLADNTDYATGAAINQDNEQSGLTRAKTANEAGTAANQSAQGGSLMSPATMAQLAGTAPGSFSATVPTTVQAYAAGNSGNGGKTAYVSDGTNNPVSSTTTLPTGAPPPENFTKAKAAADAAKNPPPLPTGPAAHRPDLSTPAARKAFVDVVNRNSVTKGSDVVWKDNLKGAIIATRNGKPIPNSPVTTY